MGKLILHDLSIPADELERRRRQAYQNLSPQEKWNELMTLIQLAIKMNGGKPIKEPQGKGLIIRKKKNDGSRYE